MKQKRKIAIGRFLFFWAAFVVTTALSCKKNIQSADESFVKVANMDKMVQFLSVTLQVSKDQVKFDSGSSEFYVANSPYREALSDVTKRYEVANEYKLNYEKK